MSELTPRQIVAALDQHIVGQQAAKRAVAIALRNRWRRQQLSPELRREVTPKNILMIGPTGVGKTEIARRLAALADAPFVKVEATRFTEVGYVGRDVEAIARDLAEVAYQMVAARAKQQHAATAERAAEDRILDALLPRRRNMGFIDEPTATDSEENATREKLRAQLRSGALDEREIEIESTRLPAGIDVLAPAGMEQLQDQLKQMFKQLGAAQKQTRKLRIAQARAVLADEEAAKRLNDDELRAHAIELAEQQGIVFIDEIDKVVQRSEWGGAGVSREGVQRDLLPLVEGTQVSTKYGALRTDHVLFIASGAFQLTRPSDLIPELQGRLPIRVELKPLTVDDLIRILTEPNAALTRQYQALLATEGVNLEFAPDAIRRIAEVAQQLNLQQENIGARRLSTVLERLLEEISYSAGEEPAREVTISAADVDRALGPVAADQDLARYVL